MMPLRVVLVDDHRLFRAGLRELLQGRGIDVVGEAPDGGAGYRLALELRPDVVLMDLDMPNVGGLEATRLLKAANPTTPVVVLTASEDDNDLFEAVKSGAQGYLLKSVDPDQLIELVRGAARGEPALTPQLASRLLAEFARLGAQVAPRVEARVEPTTRSAPAPATPVDAAPAADGAAPLEPLTAREREVLEQLMAGLANKEIAARLYVSENTVKYHLKNILQKLQLHNRAQVVAYALRHGLVADRLAGSSPDPNSA